MQTTRTVLLAVCAAAALSACASRGPGPDHPPPRSGEGPQRAGYTGFAAKPIGLFMAAMDADSDALVETAEFQAGMQASWASLSASGQPGALMYATWSKGVFGSAEALPSFISFDRNMDGVISEIEFSEFMTKTFAEMDKNGDGALARSELVFRIEPQFRPQESMGGGRPPGGGGRGDRPPPR